MPDPHSVPEIKEAIALFQKYERSAGDLSSIKGFSEAVELLNDYLEREPDSPHREFIQNLRFSNTRALLRKLASIDKVNAAAWFEHLSLVLVPLQSEAEALMANYPELKADFDAFFDIWKKDLTRVLIEDEKKGARRDDCA